MPDIRAVETTNARPVLTPWVEAAVPYLADLSVKPVTYNPPVGTGVPRRDGNYRDFKVRIHDARPIARDLSLDHQAFILAQHATAVRDFYDHDEIRRTYEPEIEALIKRETGASKVVVFDHTIRAADRGVERGHRAPVRSVHNDYTEKSGPQRVRDLLPPDEAALIKCYDSVKDGRARFTLHSAFDDPTSPKNPKPRESIETRTLAFFD